MKKIVSIGLCVLMVVLVGCSAPVPTDILSVVATIFPYYDFACQMGGRFAQVSMLIPPGGEVHGFEPTLQDLVLIENCDVFIYNGGQGDSWVEDLLKNCDTSNKQILRMMDHVALLAAEEEDHDHDHHHSHEEWDEHIFTTPGNALKMAQEIAKAMTKADETNRENYQKGFETLKGELTALSKSYEVLRSAEPPLVIADRFPFLYLTHEYNLSYVAAFSGCTANSEGDLKTLYELKRTASENQSGVILCTEFSNGQLAQTVATGIGGRVARWHSCHNVTKDEWEQKVTYVSLMKENLQVLKEALAL